ncbi:MAG: gamma-glutamyltransferase [Hyphomicrobiales bacterium]
MRSFDLPGRSTAHGQSGMAATSSPLATLAAIDILRKGGNAADAAVCASAVMCVTEPHMTAIGGDCFCLVGLPDGRVEGLNASGRASANATEDWLSASGLSEIVETNPHSVTLPGAIDGWDQLLKRHGTMELGAVLHPAIEMARDGVPVTPRVAHDWAALADKLAQDLGASEHYLIDGRAPVAGEIHAVPALARSLEIIAESGRDAFYQGEIAEDIVETLKARGGLLTMDDFAATNADWVEPISTQWCGQDVLEIPPNGVGLTALIALNILGHFDLSAFHPLSVERIHLQTEAIRMAFVARNRHIADPAFADLPIDELLSNEFAAEVAAQISLDEAVAEPENAVPRPGSDTVYLTVVDKDRMAVSFINSIFGGFGSGIVTEKSGIILQNRGSGFVTTPGHPNCIGPAKRPLHTIIPSMMRKDGEITMPFGVMGGAYQPMGHVQVAVNMGTYGMDIQEALDFPRFFPENGTLGVESTISDETMAALAEKGHDVVRAQSPFGGGQGIVIDREKGTLCGGSDPRKDGLALGF